jgi:hypothetical protein
MCGFDLLYFDLFVIEVYVVDLFKIEFDNNNMKFKIFRMS